MIAPGFYTLNMFVHLLAVSLWLGLTLNFSLLMVPLLRDLPEDLAEEQLEAIGVRARRTVTFLVLVLIGTGLVNLHRVGLLNLSGNWGSAYGITAGVKVSLAFLLFLAFPFIMVLAHRYGSDEFEDRIDRMNYLHWGVTTVTIVIMLLGVTLRG